jgi:two-component system, sensor histidine kinase and response regulator
MSVRTIVAEMHKILVIDDEAPLRQLILAALRTKGYAGLEAEDGEAGVDMARNHLPDLVLCDVMMPRMDGYATVAALRSEPATTAIPIVLMTGRPDNAGMRQGMIMGADDYLPKPFSIEELLATVEARIKMQQAIRQEAESRLSDLRANISLAMPHELFTPLSGIIGFADLLAGDTTGMSPEEISEIGRAIAVSAERLHRVIENYLIYAQIEILAADREKVTQLKESLTADARGSIHLEVTTLATKMERAADLQLDLAEGSVAMLDEYLKKIINELTGNAFKFSESGTPVVVRSNVSREGYSVSIEDRGRGMTAGQIAHTGAYMQFERKIYEQQGSGLGLVIARRLMEIHGGTMSITSTPGMGTTVTVFFPVRAS